jgi:hypothetical protein
MALSEVPTPLVAKTIIISPRNSIPMNSLSIRVVDTFYRQGVKDPAIFA